MITGYLGELFFIITIFGLLSLAVYSLLNIFYPRSPKKFKIKASVVLGFVIITILSSFPSFVFLIVILTVGLGLIYGFNKI